MDSDVSTRLAAWGAVFIMAAASLAFAYVQLDGLPDLGVHFGPDLAVRSVTVDRQSGADRQQFKRGDQLSALQGQLVNDLRDLRTVVESLPDNSGADSPASVSPEGQPKPVAGSSRTATYQLIRPLHRFPIKLQGQLDDPTALPPGVRATDRLVELDGRKLQTKVGPEAVRSIVASRPESLLVFERKNSVFSGTMQVAEAGIPYEILGIFGAVLVVLAGLWWSQSEDQPLAAAVAVGLETICAGWIALLALQYQWTMSVYGLTAVVVAAFALIRPFAFLARHVDKDRAAVAGWTAVATGAVATATVLGLLYGGYFHGPEQALHVAALIAGLFVVYEVFLASTDDDSQSSTLGDSSGYLVWILVLALFAALLAWYGAPIPFEENRWRWFAGAIVGVVWFGDVLQCVRGPASSGALPVARKVDRQAAVLGYLAEVAKKVPEVRPSLVVTTAHHSVVLEQRAGTLQIRSTSAQLHDAVAILIQEGVRVPLADHINGQAHPMGGIATTMDMALAVRLGAPADGLQLDQVELVLVGIEETSSGELPVHPSIDTLDELRALLTGPTWTAALIEGLVRLPPVGDSESAAASSDGRIRDLEAQLDVLRQQVGQRPAEEVDDPTGEGLESADSSPQGVLVDEASGGGDVGVDAFRPPQLAEKDDPADNPEDPASVQSSEFMDSLEPPPPHFSSLVEPELIEAVDYLLESDEPIILAGASGAGKTFTARCAHNREFGGDVRLWRYCADESADQQGDILFGQPDRAADAEYTGLVKSRRGAGLVIESAEQLSDAVLLRLCQMAQADDIRIYLAFEAPDAEQRSVLEGRMAEIHQLLDHRELIVPRLSHRPAILEAVLQHLLDDYLGEHDVDAPHGFSTAALERAADYDFPGDLHDARRWVHTAAGRASGEVIQPGDWPDEAS